MSGAAASASVSKFSSFMNHPAGEHPNFHIKTHSYLQQTCRTKDCVFLGAYDEVVFGRCRCKRSHPSCRQAEHVSKPWYASAPSFLRIIHNCVVPAALTATGFIWVRYSFVIIPVNYSLAAVRSIFSNSTRS